MPMNLTGMTDNEFKYLQNHVFSTLYITRKFVIPTISKDTMQIKCPYCGSSFTVSGRKHPKGLDQIEISCRDCHGRFVLVANNLYRIIVWGVQVFGFNLLYRLKKYISPRNL